MGAALSAVTAASNRAILGQGSEHDATDELDRLCSISATVQHGTEEKAILGTGNSPVAAFINGITTNIKEAATLQLLDYSQSARGVSTSGQSGEAVCVIACHL